MPGGIQADQAVGEIFLAQATLDANALTASELAQTPLSEWASKVENSGPPANMDDFQQNLNNMLEQSQRGGSRLNYTRNIAEGRMDRQIETFRERNFPDLDMNDPEQRRELLGEFAESKMPANVMLEEHKQLYRDTYAAAYEMRGSEDINPRDLPDFAQDAYDRISRQYREQIDTTVEQLNTPTMDGGEMAPASPTNATGGSGINFQQA